jgi:hypothetical protein
MFTAYYDESGSPEQRAVVASFVASDEQWLEFERNWNDTLRQFGISLFHAVDFSQSVKEFKTVSPEPDEALPAKGLIPVRYAPCGFLSIERRVFDGIAKSGSCPTYSYEGHTVNHFFQTGVVDGEILPEDYFFCELARRAGHAPFVDTAIRLRHIGRAVYERKH